MRNLLNINIRYGSDVPVPMTPRLHENPQILEKYCEKIANVYEHGEKSWEKAIVTFKEALNSIS